MIICICRNVSDKTIKDVIQKHPHIHTVKDLKKHLDVCNQCGKCRDSIVSMIKEPVGSVTKKVIMISQ